jgi:protein involved in plasmid replication-relaxation
MTGNQLHRTHFQGPHISTQARKARAAMRRLTELRLVVRLERRVGGIRSGSDGYIYGLSGLGHAVLDLGQAVRRRHRRVPETKLAFESHVLAVSELAVCLGEQAVAGRGVVEEFRAEPGSWRPFGGLGGGVRVLKPDAYVRLGVGEYETTAFIEQDMATESLPTIGRKLGVYLDYWRSGIEQEAHDVFPRVWWLVPNRERLTALQHAIQQLPPHTHELFAVALSDHAPDLLIQLPNSEGGAL